MTPIIRYVLLIGVFSIIFGSNEIKAETGYIGGEDSSSASVSNATSAIANQHSSNNSVNSNSNVVSAKGGSLEQSSSQDTTTNTKDSSAISNQKSSASSTTLKSNAATSKDVTTPVAGAGVSSNLQATSVQVEPSSGSANLSIPIVVPPGRAGIQPNLALVYSSSARQLGNAGVGWSLDLSSIQISSQKGVPKYDGTDIFTMEQNGATQDLVADPSTAGLYHMEVEGSFANIQYYTTYWVVTDKKGIKYYYGNYGSTTGCIQNDPANPTHIFRWALSKVEDLNGNYMTISYLNDQGQIYPQTISYTGNDQSSLLLSPYAQVSIVYAAASQPSISYISQFLVETAQRIDHITISIGPDVQSTYTFTYLTSPDTGRDLLQSVQQIGSNGTTTLPAVSFKYNTVANSGSKSFTLASGWNIPPVPFTVLTSASNTTALPPNHVVDNGVRVVDITGDGYSDFILSNVLSETGYGFQVRGVSNNINRAVYLNNKNQSWSYNSNLSSSNLDAFVDYAFGDWISYRMLQTSCASNYGLQFIDLDGNGTVDYVESYLANLAWSDGYETINLNSNNQNIWNYQGGYITQDSSWSLPNIFFSIDTQSLSVMQPGDIFYYSNSAIDNVSFADVNGDGFPDLVASSPNYSGQVYLNQLPQGNKSFQLTSYSLPSGVSNLNNGTVMMDLNGDGLADILNITASSSYFYYNTGNGWAQDTNSPWTQVDTTNCDLSNGNGTLIDLNGDGLPDLVCIGSSPKVYINTGHGWYLDSSWSLPGANFTDNSTQFLYADGSGMPDYMIYGYYTGTPQLYLNPGFSSSDLLIGINNGIGASTSIQYDSVFHYQNTYMPFFMPVVKSMATTVGSQTYTTNYIYAGGLWDKTYHEFDGFQTVTIVDAQGNYVTTSYLQDHWLKGKAQEVDTYAKSINSNDPPGTNGILYSKTINQWQTQTIATNSNFTVGGTAQTSKFIYLSRTDNYLYDASTDGSYKQTAQEYVYGENPQYGDATQVINDGQIDPSTNLSIDSNRTITNTRYVYNTNNWIIGLPTTVATLDTNNNQISKTSYFYDGDTTGTASPSLGRLTSKVNWLGSNTQPDPKTSYTYDAYGNLQTTIDPNGNPTSITYDNTVHIFPVKTTNALNQSVTMTYYGIDSTPLNNSEGLNGLWGQQASTTDANNQTAYTTYDTFGRPSATISPLDTAALPTEQKSYNIQSNYIEVTDTKRVTSGTTQTISSTSFYDGLGRLIETKSLGPTAGLYIVSGQTQYDSRGLPVTKYLSSFTTKDLNTLDPINSEAPSAKQAYDPMGRVITKTNPDGTYSSIKYNQWTTTTTDENGHMQQSIVDAFGHLVQKLEYMGADGRSSNYPAASYTLYATTNYTYDPRGELITVTDAHNNVTTITYDNLGRKIAMNDPDMGNWSYGYDNNGNLQWQKDAKGQVISFTYDALNRLTNKNDSTLNLSFPNLSVVNPQPATFNVTYNYDTGLTNSIGRLGSVNYDSGRTVFWYDALGREFFSGKIINSQPFAVLRQFDALNHLTLLQYPDGSQVNYGYNQAGQIYKVFSTGQASKLPVPVGWQEMASNKSSFVDSLLGIKDAYARNVSSAPMPTAETYIASIGYNANGQINQVQYGNGVSTAYTYDPLMFRLKRIYTTNAQNVKLQDLNYSYDALGQVLTITDRVNTGVNSMTQSFSYDALNRLVSAQGNYGTKTYAYDSIGNITLKDGLTYNYAEANSRTDGSAAGPHAVTSLSDGTIFKYDLNGNMVSLQKGDNLTQYIYDSQNRLSKVTVGGLTIASYGYDGDGGRTQKIVTRRDLALYNDNVDATLFGSVTNPLPATAANPTVDTTVDVGNLYETESGTSRNTKFIYLGDTRVAANGSDGTVMYYHDDHLGGTNVLTDQTGIVRELTEYDPFGQVFIHEKYGNNSATAWYYFTGKPLDDETGLIFLGARYYNPTLGRFITPDTKVQAPNNPQTLNRYTYCNNNPVNLIDPTGQDWFDNFLGAVGNFFDNLIGHIYVSFFNVISIASTIIPSQIISSIRNLIGSNYWQGGEGNQTTSSTITTLASGAFQNLNNAFSQAVNSAGGEGLETGDQDVLESGSSDAASTGSSSDAARGSVISANASFYQTGDLVKAFNSLESDIYEKVAYADQIMNQASESASLAVDAQGLQDTWSPFDFMGGAVSGSKALVSAGLNAGDNAVFYTGGDIAKEQAMAFAEQVGGRTILDTPIGQVLETFKAPDFVWQSASRVFAESATGEADVFIGEDASWSRTYGSIEADILDKNGVDVTIHDAV